jgi:hypothetical protein
LKARNNLQKSHTKKTIKPTEFEEGPRRAAMKPPTKKKTSVRLARGAIGTEGASDEIRGCALNNRADERRDRGDFEGAIRDRTELLGLRETTFNRRFKFMD